MVLNINKVYLVINIIYSSLYSKRSCVWYRIFSLILLSKITCKEESTLLYLNNFPSSIQYYKFVQINFFLSFTSDFRAVQQRAVSLSVSVKRALRLRFERARPASNIFRCWVLRREGRGRGDGGGGRDERGRLEKARLWVIRSTCYTAAVAGRNRG